MCVFKRKNVDDDVVVERKANLIKVHDVMFGKVVFEFGIEMKTSMEIEMNKGGIIHSPHTTTNYTKTL